MTDFADDDDIDFLAGFADRLGEGGNPMPLDLRTLPRPRANSWLDKRARRMAEIFSEEHGMVGFDPDLAYLVFAEDIRQTRDRLSLVMGDAPASVQRYIDDKSLRARVELMAAGFAGEKPGSDPFADEESILMTVPVWSRALWSLLIAAEATRPFSVDFGASMVKIATSMSGVMYRATAEEKKLVFSAPKGGAAYVARTLAAAADQVEAWECPVDGLETGQLVEGLRHDSELVTALIDRAV